MNSIILYIRAIFSKRHYNHHLGRWRIEQCPNKINTKIDLANEDHCGPCGNSTLWLKPIDKMDKPINYK